MVRKLQLLILMCFLAILSWQCSKDQLNPDETKISGFKRAANSKERLASIRSTFNSRNIGASVQFKNKSSKTTWVPDWDHPMVNQVNDSVLYVFYPLLRNINRDGKIDATQVTGANTYLIVKNEETFFKGIYTPKDNDSKNSLSDFTGVLDLINLENNTGVAIPYANGVASEDYMKKGSELAKKKNSGGATTLGWEQTCYTKTTCTYNAFCTNQVLVAAVEGCGYPQMAPPNDCTEWRFIESNSWEVCDNIYIPDPPTNPGGGGEDGGGDNPGEPSYEPDLNPERTCIVANLLKTQAKFRSNYADLKSKLNLNYEVGYYTTAAGTNTMVQGTPNSASIDPSSFERIMTGFIHTHYNDPKMLSIFSWDDMYVAKGGMQYLPVNGMDNYYFGVITAKNGGTSYIFTITDRYKFGDWGALMETPPYISAYNLLISAENSNATNEKNFLTLTANAGITLLKPDPNSPGEWVQVKKDENNDVQTIKCN